MTSRKLRLPLLILLSLTLAHAGDVRNGEDVLRAMHDPGSGSRESVGATAVSSRSSLSFGCESLGAEHYRRIDEGEPQRSYPSCSMASPSPATRVPSRVKIRRRSP